MEDLKKCVESYTAAQELLGGAGDQSVIRWTEGMGTNLSEAEVFWDFMEVGAPLVLLPNRGGELDPREVKYGAWERL